MFSAENLKTLEQLKAFIGANQSKYSEYLSGHGLSENALEDAILSAEDFLSGFNAEEVDDYDAYDDEDDDYDEDSISPVFTGFSADELEHWNQFVHCVFALIFMAEAGVVQVDFSKYSEDSKLLCSELSDYILGGMHVLRQSVSGVEQSEQRVEYDILANLRKDMPFEEYKTSGVVKDFELIHKLLFVEPVNDTYNMDVLNDIANLESTWAFMSGLNDHIDNILNCYKEMFANTFSLYPYQGVIAFFGKQTNGQIKRSYEAIMREDSTAEMFKASPCSSEFNSLVTALRSFPEIDSFARNVQTDLCFDVAEIAKSNKALYYPFEIFTLATGAELRDSDVRVNGQAITFKSAGMNSWTEYEKLVRPRLVQLMHK